MDTITARVADFNEYPNIMEFLKSPEVDNLFKVPLSQREKTFEKRVFRDNVIWTILVNEFNLIVGCWSYTHDTDHNCIIFSTLAIHPSLKGLGLGETLFLFTINHALGKHPHALQFDSWEGNYAISNLAKKYEFNMKNIFLDEEKRGVGGKTIVYERRIR